MNVPESNSAAAVLDFIVDGDTNFKRDMVYKENGVAVDTSTWAGEFVVFYKDQCKEVYNWNTVNGDLLYSPVGTYTIDELIDVAGGEIKKGNWEYYFKLTDAAGVALKYLKGQFEVK